jgi:hypothetical protein
MHATRDTYAVISSKVVGGRVMRGVGRLVASPKSQGLAGRILTTENGCD